ncbi:SUKH-4 family immunity protein [Phytomonospora sp. NPDC050363]|uniref:SUKH-4 family immunity protein n=1 Tax=Phytomonospora sp. NPDC050363 TaxID=3155642 RepID=UPI0033D2554E
MPTAAEYGAAWGRGNTVPYPRAAWMKGFSAPSSSYPAIDFIPVDVPAVFTSRVDGELGLYDRVDVQIAGDRPLRFVIVGAVPRSPETWFVLDTVSGAVSVIDVDAASLEAVNTGFARFLDFLYHFGLFARTDGGDHAGLRRTLEALDPGAFADAGSWWPAVFARLGDSPAG